MREGWEMKKLDDVCNVIGGGTPSRLNAKFFDGDINWATVRDMKGDLIISTEFKITEDAVKSSSTNIIPRRNVVIATRVGLGKICMIDKDTAINQDLRGIIPKRSSELSVRYLFLWFKSVSHLIKEEGTGATIQGVKLPFIKSLMIPLPSFSEQQHIVSILDEAFEAIAQAKANAEQNLKNARELFESQLETFFLNKGEDWGNMEFGNIIETLTDYHANGSYEILKEHVVLKESEDYAWMIRSTDFENNFKNNLKYIDKAAYDFLKKSKVYGREIIMSKIGNAGNVYLMPEIDRPCSLAMNLFLIRVNEKRALPEYIYLYLKSIVGETQIKSRLLGMATKTITKDNVRSILIPVAPLAEQKTIVQKLDALSAQTKKLEAIYQQKIADLDELKKSLLQKAFNGELKTTELVEV